MVRIRARVLAGGGGRVMGRAACSSGACSSNPNANPTHSVRVRIRVEF